MKETSIKISTGHIEVSYQISYGFDGKYYNATIPAFDMFFCTTDEDKIQSRADSMIKTFFNYWAKSDKKTGFKNLILDLHKLGFRTENHNFAMKNLLNKQTSGGIFKIDAQKFVTEEYPETKQYILEAA